MCASSSGCSPGDWIPDRNARVDAPPAVGYSCSPFTLESSMWITRAEHRCQPTQTIGLIVAAVVLTVGQNISATTYISVEPIPNQDVVGAADLARLRSIGYSRLERWSELLLSQCL